jgi:hypothetical protein
MVFNKVWILGRRSELAYLRFYPNPGFMIPWVRVRRYKGALEMSVVRLLWNKHDGWFTRAAGNHVRPGYGSRKG